MNGWTVGAMPWNCGSCRAFIPVGERFWNGEAATYNTSPVCLSCILTASASLLPGQPKSIRVEWIGASGWNLTGHDDPAALPGGQQYRLTVDGVEYGVMTVDAGIAGDQQVPALLALVRQALKWRAEGKLKPRIAEENPILDAPSYVPAEPGPYRYQPHEPLLRCASVPLAPDMESITSDHGRPDLKITPPFTVRHPEIRPSDACPCLRPIFGRWHDIPPDYLAPYGLNRKWSALKGCKTCAGTGRVPPPATRMKMQPCQKFYQHTADRKWGLGCSGCGWPAASHPQPVVPCHIDPGLGSVGRGEPEPAPVCQGGAWDNPAACLMHEGLPIGPDGLCIEGRWGRSAPR